MKRGNILWNISPQSVLLARQYFMYLIYWWSLIVWHRLTLMITVIIILMIPDILILFLVIFLRLIFWKELQLRIDFSSELINEFLHLILIPIEPFERYLPAAFHFIHLYRQLYSGNGIIRGICLRLMREGVASHKHLFKWKRFFIYCCCRTVFHIDHLETETARDLSEQLENFCLAESEWNVNFQKWEGLLH